MTTSDGRRESAIFLYNPEHRTITIALDNFVTVLGPFKDEEAAAAAAHEFCLAYDVAPQAYSSHKNSRELLSAADIGYNVEAAGD